MALILNATYTVPTWAITYLEYGDASGLSDDEAAAIDAWVSEFGAPLTFEWGTVQDFVSASSLAVGGEFGAGEAIDCDVYEYRPN